MGRQITFLSCLVVFFVLTSPVLAEDRLVPDEYSTIQAAIDAAVAGDEVIIAQDTYTGTGNRDLDFGGKAITVRSTDPNNPAVVEATIIDCQNSQGHRGFYFHSGENANSIVAGIIIKRGNIISSTDAKGGGIYCTGSSPTIKNCVITNNNASGISGAYGSGDNGGNAHGGGIYCTSNSDPVIIGCKISSNKASGGAGADTSMYLPPAGHGGKAYGGGIYCSSNSNPTIKNCEISGNKSRGGNGGSVGVENFPGNGGEARGGGICVSSVTINECEIKNNKSQGGTGGGPEWYGGDAYGGGIYGGGTIENSILSENNSYGGDEGPPFGATQNSGTGYGGGMYCTGSSTISNCLIISNLANSHSTGETGGILDSAGGTQIKNCTICNNTSSFVGGVEALEVGTTLTDCILWGNGDDLDGCSATYCCIEDNDAGTGNIHSDPCFVTGWLGDYYLSQMAAGQDINSPCVDAGSDTAANLEMDELTTRIDLACDEGTLDMGYHYPRINNAFVDIDGDGIVDMEDFVILGLQWRKGYQEHGGLLTADIAPIGGDRIVDVCDVGFLAENWLWRKGPIGHWKFDEGSGTDANDSSGNENNGTLAGDPCWVPGKIGDYALEFDGDNDYVETTTLNDIHEPISISVWINTNGSEQIQTIFGRNKYTGSYYYQNFLRIGTDNKIYFGDRPGSGDSHYVISTQSIEIEQWYHLTITRASASDIKLYINGELDNSDYTIPYQNPGINYRIGTINTGHFPFDGITDDVRIYNCAISEEEISRLYQEGLD